MSYSSVKHRNFRQISYQMYIGNEQTRDYPSRKVNVVVLMYPRTVDTRGLQFKRVGTSFSEYVAYIWAGLFSFSFRINKHLYVTDVLGLGGRDYYALNVTNVALKLKIMFASEKDRAQS